MVKHNSTTLNSRNNNKLKSFYSVFVLISGILLLNFITACVSTDAKHINAKNQQLAVPNTPKNLSKINLKQLLTQQHRDWKGTPYKLGGNSKNGIDCSGFVHITFKQRLGLKLPRTTSQLSKTGMKISRNQLTIGDLVFFTTGFSKRHVGIYMGNNSFLHASTSKGVMISSMDSPYWSKHYWKATRILAI